MSAAAAFDWGAALPELEGRRVRLGPLVAGDAAVLLSIFGDPDDQASLRLFERRGFRREGRLRERWLQGGRFQDAVFPGLPRCVDAPAGDLKVARGAGTLGVATGCTGRCPCPPEEPP